MINLFGRSIAAAQLLIVLTFNVCHIDTKCTDIKFGDEIHRVCQDNPFIKKITVIGCAGVTDLPLKLGTPSTHTQTGDKEYKENDMNRLARRLMSDIRGLTQEYAKIIADDAMSIDENHEISYSFYVKSGTAKLTQFKINSAILGNPRRVNIKWYIIEAVVSYTAQQDIRVKVTNSPFFWQSRRRCTRKISNRGIRKHEIEKIHSNLLSVIKKIGSKDTIFTFTREHKTKEIKLPRLGRPGLVIPDHQTALKKQTLLKKKVAASCPAWKPSITLHITRSCSKIL